jgi:hypothetical protein
MLLKICFEIATHVSNGISRIPHWEEKAPKDTCKVQEAEGFINRMNTPLVWGVQPLVRFGSCQIRVSISATWGKG